ncbi:nuclear transport factor 2 family protein [Planctobacterium marinum]|uniref:Transcriptional regulator n=1 Tax=Planctobacterium marinum TaxID=1631968 RepID=A0AA48I7A5_9ALTE|nr:transcriptional regulator [Planctobacterium marinum]
MSVLDTFAQFYKALHKDNLHMLQDIYHQDIRFVDPVGQHEGLSVVESYFRHLLETTISCEFDIKHVVAHDSYAIARWEMILRHPKLSGGKVIKLDGTSELIIKNDKIIQQTDFYDMGAMFYEHIPILSTLVRFVKNKIKNYQDS